MRKYLPIVSLLAFTAIIFLTTSIRPFLLDDADATHAEAAKEMPAVREPNLEILKQESVVDGQSSIGVLFPAAVPIHMSLVRDDRTRHPDHRTLHVPDVAAFLAEIDDHLAAVGIFPDADVNVRDIAVGVAFEADMETGYREFPRAFRLGNDP